MSDFISLLKKPVVPIFIILILSLPIIANLALFSWGSSLTNGKLDTWIGFFATYYGAIKGGVVSGALTLLGVRITIKSTMDVMHETIKEQRQIRDEDLLIQTNKERLIKLFSPINTLINNFHYKYGAHDFIDLSTKEQLKFINFLVENEVYVNREISIKVGFRSISWTPKC